MKKYSWLVVLLGICLSGYAGEQRLVLNTTNQIASGDENWSGISDGSATVLISPKPNGDLQVEIAVTDDVLFTEGAKVYLKDSAELYLDVRPGKKRGNAWYERGVFQLIIDAESGEASWLQKGGGRAWVPDAVIQSKKTEAGYTVSILLPAAGLKENHFPIEDGFNLAIGINDFDSAGKHTKLLSSGTSENWQNPSEIAAYSWNKTTGELSLKKKEAVPEKVVQVEEFPSEKVSDNTAVYEITDQVLVKNPPRFGSNVHLPRFQNWMGFQPVNQWAKFSGFEPVIYRHQRIATGGSETTLEDTAAKGLSWWDSFQGDWWAGADVIIYRETTDNSMEVVRRGTVKSSDCGKGSTHSLVFEESGPAVQAGDLYQLTARHITVPPMRQNAWRFFGNRRRLNDKQLPHDDPRIEQHYDPENVAPGGGQTSLKVVLNSSGRGGFVDYFLFNPVKNPTFTHLPESVDELTVRFQARQEGLSGDLRFEAGPIKESFSVGKKWKTYEFTFTPDVQKGVSMIGFTAPGPGTFWIDNLAIWDADYEFAKPYPFVVDALKKARPGTLRIFDGFFNKNGIRFEDAIRPDFLRETHLSIDSMHGHISGSSLHDMLELCKEVGADPWITISPTYTPEELAHFAEYLGGPATTPYGKKRKDLGQTEPWVDLFDHIYIELGNEQWNPGYTTVFGLDGAGLYGRFAKMQFTELKKSPYYAPEKMKTIANGFTKNNGMFNNRCLDAAQGAADIMDVGVYLRGGWDTEDILSDNDDPLSDETLLGQLNYFVRLGQPDFENAIALAQEHDTDLAIYEMGPGYDLPGPNVKQDPRDEIVGKSLLLAVTTLDAFMFAQEHDMKAINFFNFKPGTRWATHADQNLKREHIAWLALTLRNLYCTGDLMTVNPLKETVINLPSVTVGGKGNFGEVKETQLPALPNVPTTRAFAYSDEESCSVLMFSRNLHEPTEITLKFPFTPEPKGILYTLTHDDPLARNTEEMQVPIREENVYKIGKEHTLTLPPHSVYLLRVNKAK